jgi:hypothetical protein
MGGACSTGISPAEKRELQLELDPDTTAVISKLNLFQDDVNILWHAFCAIDKEHSHSLDMMEFLRFYNIEDSLFAKKVFRKVCVAA